MTSQKSVQIIFTSYTAPSLLNQFGHNFGKRSVQVQFTGVICRTDNWSVVLHIHICEAHTVNRN